MNVTISKPAPRKTTRPRKGFVVERVGRFSVFKFSSELKSDEIKTAMHSEDVNACDHGNLDTFNRSFEWNKGQLVALGGQFFGGPMYVCYTPVLQNGKIDLLENIYGDRGRWDSAFYFLAK